MKKFEVIYVKQPELPLFTKKLEVNRIEMVVEAKSFKSLRRKLTYRRPDGFTLLGVKEIK